MSMRQRAAAGVPWWLFLLTGIAWLLVSLIVLRFNITSVASVGVLLGVILIMAGANEFVIMAARPGWKWLHAILGVLFMVVATTMATPPLLLWSMRRAARAGTVA